MHKTIKAHFALLIVNIIYGLNYSIAKEVMPEYVMPFAFVLMRVGGALILFWIASAFFTKEKIDRKDFPRIALLAFFGVAVNQLLFLKGLSLTSPINASIIMLSNPIIVLIASALVLKEKISKIKITGVFFGLTGAFLLLFFNKSFSIGSATAIGDIMILINSMSWAIFIIMLNPLIKKYNAFTIVKWVFLFGFIYVLPFGYSEFKQINWHSIPPNIYWGIGFVVVATTFIAYFLNTYALRELKPEVVSIYIYFQPFIAALVAIYYFNNDEFDTRKLISGILIIVGIYLVSMRLKKT